MLSLSNYIFLVLPLFH